MQEQFNFSKSDPINAVENFLGIQVSLKHFRYGIYNPDNNELLQLKHFSFEQLSGKELDTIIEHNTILQGHFQKIICSLDFGFSSLLPTGLGHAESAPLMYLENADQQDHVISETLPGSEITNMYTVPPAILTQLVHQFPSSVYLHHHSIAIQSIKEFPEAGLIRVDVQSNRFTVIAFKATQLLIARTFSYSAPADVVFYLLKICEQFRLSQEEVILQISGLVDTHSKLYREIYDYFLHFWVKPVDWLDGITGLPAHYFTSLNELTQCELLQEV